MSHIRDSFQHTNQRQLTLPTVYEENDPYRTVKKGPRLESISDNSDADVIHSRSASDSSTTRLYNGPGHLPSNFQQQQQQQQPKEEEEEKEEQTLFYDDPYYNKKPRAPRIESDRAYSYLPYSHHQRDPNQAPTSIYLENEPAPLSSSLGIGSLLQDSYSNINGLPPQKEADTQSKIEPLPERKKRKRRICGLSYRIVALITLIFVIIIVVIWYFVWPRIPTLSLDDIDIKDQLKIPTNTTQKSITTSWLVNITADNSANWVPTRFSYWDITITDDATDKQFGHGRTNSFVLAPRKSSIITFLMNIYYETADENDTTFQDLYNACGIQEKTSVADQTKQGLLNATFHVTHHISGIVWSTTTSIPAIGLDCPT